jgi:hypothetical protein
MNRLYLAVGLLAASATLFAENAPTTDAASSNATSAATSLASSAAALPPAPAVAQQSYSNSGNTAATDSDWKHNQPIFTAAIGGTYTKSDLTDVDGSIGSAFWGFYGVPTVQLTRYVGLRTDFEQDFGTHSQYNDVRLLRMTAGPVFTYPLPYIKKWTTPFIYMEGGATRISYFGVGRPVYDATADAGIGFQVPITRRVAFQIIPGEYSAINVPSNDNYSSQYSAKAGLVWNFYGNR